MMNNAYTSIRALPSSAEVKTWEQCIWTGTWEDFMKVVTMTLREVRGEPARHSSIFVVWVFWWGWCMGQCCGREVTLKRNLSWNPLFVGNKRHLELSWGEWFNLVSHWSTWFFERPFFFFFFFFNLSLDFISKWCSALRAGGRVGVLECLVLETVGGWVRSGDVCGVQRPLH